MDDKVPKMDEASRCLSLSESGAKKQYKAAKAAVSSHRFQPGLEWDILHADAIILLGMTHALRSVYFVLQVINLTLHRGCAFPQRVLPWIFTMLVSAPPVSFLNPTDLKQIRSQ